MEHENREKGGRIIECAKGEREQVGFLKGLEWDTGKVVGEEGMRMKKKKKKRHEGID